MIDSIKSLREVKVGQIGVMFSSQEERMKMSEVKNGVHDSTNNSYK